jgi:DNA repair/transcription protein MET18/MMS19
MVDSALHDTGVDDLLACVSSPGADPQTFRRSVARAKAATATLCALCRAGGGAASRAVARALPPLLDVAEQPASLASRALAWTVLVEMLRALGGAAGGAAAAAASPQLCARIAAAAAALGVETDAESAASQQEAPPRLWATKQESYGAALAGWAQVAALRALLGAAPLAGQLQAGEAEAVLGALLAVVAGGESSAGTQAEAVEALCAMAVGPHAAVLARRGLPALLQAATRPQGQRTPALDALQRLSAADAGVQLEVMQALDQAVQLTLPAAARPGGGAAAELAVDLLQAAAGIAGAPDGSAAQRQAAVVLAQHLLDAALLAEEGAAGSPPALLEAAARAVFEAARQSEAQQQAALAADAAAALLVLLPQPAGGARSLQAAACAAALVPLRPDAAAQLLAREEHRDVPAVLLAGALQHVAASPYLSLAAAALLNKSPTGGFAALPHSRSCFPCVFRDERTAHGSSQTPRSVAAGADAAAEDVLRRVLLPAANSVDGGSSAQAWAAVAAVGRAMAMRGSPTTAGLVAQLVAALQTPAAEQAAACFASLLRDDDAPGAVALSRRSHAVVKPLWQQRAYTIAASALSAALRSAAAAAMQVDAAPGAAPPDPSAGGGPLPLLLGAAHLLCAAPSAVLRADLPRALPLALRCLGALQLEARPGEHAPLLRALLDALAQALQAEAGRAQAAGSLQAMVPALTGLAAYRPAMGVRALALRCLLLLTQLPYTAQHPYRKAVARAAAAATDDDKRSVRAQAAECRQAWSGA